MMPGFLTSLELQNWVSYATARFDFHPNVNMIIGESGHGKSAMLSAFYKLIYNRPMGDEFVSWWGGETRLILSADNWILEYWKKKSKAGFHLNKDGIDFPLNAVGAAVPDEISRLLNLSAELNIQKQFKKKAPIFLLSETPGDAAKKLNEFANLTSIDTTIQVGKSDISETKREIKTLENQIAAKEKALEQYSGLDELGSLLDAATKLESKKNDLKVKIADITDCLDTIVDLKIDVDEYDDTDNLSELVKKALVQKKKKENNSTLLRALLDGLEEIKEIRQALQASNEIKNLSPVVREAFKFTKIINQYGNRLIDLQSSLAYIKDVKKRIKKLENQSKQLQQKYIEKFPDICPLCHSKVDKGVLCK